MSDLPPEYKRKFNGQYMDIFNTTTDKPCVLLESLNKSLEENYCIKVDSLIKTKWSGIWTSIKKWYKQIDFTVSVYRKEGKLIVIFSRMQSPINFSEYMKMCITIANDCNEIDEGKFKNYNSDMSTTYEISEISYSIDKMKNMINIILTCYLSTYCEEESRNLATICDGNSEFHLQNQETFILNFPDVIFRMLNSNKSVLIHCSAQALLQILLRSKQPIVVERIGDVDYSPMEDKDLSIALEYAQKLII